LLLLLQQEVEVIVEPGRPRLHTGTELALPLLAMTRAVHIHTRDKDSASAIQALDTRLCANDVYDQRHVAARKLAQSREFARSLENMFVEIPHSQLLGQSIGIALVALRSSTRCDPSNHEFVHVRIERLVQPSTLQPFFEHEMLVARDHPDRFD
jgi:hypothetical protein